MLLIIFHVFIIDYAYVTTVTPHAVTAAAD